MPDQQLEDLVRRSLHEAYPRPHDSSLSPSAGRRESHTGLLMAAVGVVTALAAVAIAIAVQRGRADGAATSPTITPPAPTGAPPTTSRPYEPPVTGLPTIPDRLLQVLRNPPYGTVITPSSQRPAVSVSSAERTATRNDPYRGTITSALLATVTLNPGRTPTLTWIFPETPRRGAVVPTVDVNAKSVALNFEIVMVNARTGRYICTSAGHSNALDPH